MLKSHEKNESSKVLPFYQDWDTLSCSATKSEGEWRRKKIVRCSRKKTKNPILALHQVFPDPLRVRKYSRTVGKVLRQRIKNERFGKGRRID